MQNKLFGLNTQCKLMNQLILELFTSFDQCLIDEVTEVQKIFKQMELAVEQHYAEKTKFQTKMENVLKENDRLLRHALSVEIVDVVPLVLILLAVTPKNQTKQVRRTAQITKSEKIYVAISPSPNIDFNTPVLSSTRVALVSSASGSQSQDNTKKNRIRRTHKKAKETELEDHLRNIKSSLNKASFVNSRATSSVIKFVSNVNSNLKYASCNGCLFFDNHDACVVEYINYVNASRKSKYVKKPVKRKVWKSTGKVFKTVGYKWKPTGRILHACVHCVTTESELKTDFIKKEYYETLLKQYHSLEKHCISLEVNNQLNMGIFQRDNVSSSESAPTFAELFKTNELKAQIQEKDTVILKLKEKIMSSSGDVKERKSVEVADLNASLQEKVLVITALKEQLKGKAVLTKAVSLNLIDPALLQVDVVPLVHKLRKNMTAHIDYIRHTQEEAATLRELVHFSHMNA
nr:hypothetical protein [Tanacetum cinerariifolium]